MTEPEVIEPEVIEPNFSNFSNIENSEIQLVLSRASNLTSLIKEAKTNAKRDLYKRKMKKLQKEMQVLLYSQYFQNKALNIK